MTLAAVSDEFLAEKTNKRSVRENVQLGHRPSEILYLQIASDGNGLTTSRIFPKESRQIPESQDWLILLFLVLRWDGCRHWLLGSRLGSGADGGFPEAAPLPLTEMIRGGDVCGATLPAAVTLVDILRISFAMTGYL